jgi:four helix bundle suffix protein
MVRFRALRCATLNQFRAWVADETRRYEREYTGEKEHTHKHTQTRLKKCSKVRVGPCPSVSLRDFPAVCAANGAIALLNLCIYLVGRQLEAQARAFEREGGFTERLYRTRQARRRPP